MLTVAEVQEVLARPKLLAAEMAWTMRRGKLTFAWIEARIPVQFTDEPEISGELYVMCQWKKKGNVAPEQWKYALFCRDERVYAIDVQPAGRHTNDKAGKGRPLYLERIGGIHEHTWSKEGYGYAEPINVPLDQPEVIWRMFLHRANISLDGDGEFFHPDNNQPELL